MVARCQGECVIFGAAQKSLESAAAVARSRGYSAYILSDRIEGEAQETARVHAALVHQIRVNGQPFRAPCILLSGGETMVTFREKGKGGRNTEFLLLLSLEISGVEGVTALLLEFWRELFLLITECLDLPRYSMRPG